MHALSKSQYIRGKIQVQKAKRAPMGLGAEATIITRDWILAKKKGNKSSAETLSLHEILTLQ